MDTIHTTTPGTALTVIQRAQVALGAAEHEKKLVALAAQSTEIVAITNPASYQQLHSARMELKNERIALEKLGKAARDDATKFSKAVIAEEARLIAIIEPEEKRLQTIQTAHDQRVAIEKAAREQAERERVEQIQAAIAELRAIPIKAVGKPALVIAELIRDLDAQWAADCGRYAEFGGEAEAAKVESAARLSELLAAAQAHEAALEQARRDREELARLKAEEDQRQREAAEREAAEIRARAEADAKRLYEIQKQERAARDRIEAQQRAAQAEIDKANREARERHAAEDARQQAERDRIAEQARQVEAAARAQREAAEAAERQARAEQEAKELAAREVREQVEREARQKEEAEQREIQRQADELAAQQQRLFETDKLIGVLAERIKGLPQYAGIEKAIAEYIAMATAPAAAKKRRAAA